MSYYFIKSNLWRSNITTIWCLICHYLAARGLHAEANDFDSGMPYSSTRSLKFLGLNSIKLWVIAHLTSLQQ